MPSAIEDLCYWLDKYTHLDIDLGEENFIEIINDVEELVITLQIGDIIARNTKAVT
jgi:hypothetical protein